MDICNQIKTKTGTSITEYARHTLGVSRQTLYESLRGNGSREVRLKIAFDLETKPSELFEYSEQTPFKALCDDEAFRLRYGVTK